MHTARIVRLICGYPGSGKDTVGKQLNTGKGPYSWAIYKHLFSRTKFPYGLGFRVAFADEVKRQVKKELVLPKGFDIEKQKNEVVKDGRTFRSFCIEKGCSMRSKDPYYWARLTFNRVEKTDLPGMPTCTDWRFVEEEQYSHSVGETVSIRVFRKDVPVPPNSDPDRSLDKFMTDFLLVPKKNHEEEIISAKRLFPQYQDFVYYDTLEKNPL